MVGVYFRDSLGVLVFWGICRLFLFDEVLLWREKVKEVCLLVLCVLVIDNISKELLEWIGFGRMFDSDLVLEKFCNNKGFVDYFEIKIRDWESGENSVFG